MTPHELLEQKPLIQPIRLPYDSPHTIEVLRLDLIHPTITGNKWYKLRYNLQQAQTSQHDTLLTFGGAYSNHIFATAAAGKLFGFKTVGVIRGEPTFPLNTCLSFAQSQGMSLIYLDRAAYKQKETTEVLQELQKKVGRCYVIPEGGSNIWAAEGLKDLALQLPKEYDVVLCACGTGTTLAGLRKGLPKKTHLIGIPVLKQGESLHIPINNLLTNKELENHYTLLTTYHGGGYAKTSLSLLQFIADFQLQTQIPLEEIYTGKLFWALHQLLEKQYFGEKHKRILVVHSGGHQLVKHTN